MAPTILVVDDEPHHRQICNAILRHHQYRVLLAENGHEGIRIAGDQIPELILMDVRMPVLGGIEAFRTLKQDPATAGIPVVAFTADGARHRPADLLREGFSHCIEKPCHPREIVRVVQQIVEPGVITSALYAESLLPTTSPRSGMLAFG